MNSSTRTPTTPPVPTRVRSTSRCHRHHVWMASCTDCRQAHAPLVRRERRSTTAR